MGLEKAVGQIGPGQRVDLMLVDGKPDEDITQIEQVEWMMKDGEMVDLSVLLGAPAIQTR